MGLILDSSVIIAAERRRISVADLLRQIVLLHGDQDVALSAIGLTELYHGVFRSSDEDILARKKAFILALLSELPVYPYTSETSAIAGRIDADQRSRGIVVPFADLLIGATALSLGYAVLTNNARHFSLIPGLSVITY